MTADRPFRLDDSQPAEDTASDSAVVRADAAPEDAVLGDAAVEVGFGARNQLGRRLADLPPGHPSSPYETDGSRRAPVTRLRDLELPATDPYDHVHPLTDAEHAEHIADVRARLEKAHADGLATDQQYTIDPARELGSDDRDAQHDLIIEDLYGQAANVPNEYRAIIAGGLGGAGKSTVLAEHANIDRSQYLTINPDDVKEEMARRGMIPSVEGLSPMEASDLVHEESSYLARQLALRAQQDGKNVLWDVTMSSRASTERRIGELRSSGYANIQAIFIDIPIETSARRAESRHREGHDNFRAGHGLGGRIVPPEVIHGQSDDSWGSINSKTFEELKSRFNEWSRYDNSVDGRPPVLAELGQPQTVDSQREVNL
jgi:predicted kinase